MYEAKEINGEWVATNGTETSRRMGDKWEAEQQAKAWNDADRIDQMVDQMNEIIANLVAA